MGQLASRQQDNENSNPNNPEATWWCKLLARVVGAVGAFIAIILGVMCFINIIYPRCIGAGILQIFAAFIVLVFEAPMCCQFFEWTKPIASFAENRTFFQKALIYGFLAIPPIAICFGLTTLFGSGLIFAAGVIYGLMALGKKADRETMREQAVQQQTPKGPSDDPELKLVEHDANTMDTGNPFASGNAQQVAGHYAGQYAGQYVASQFTK